jgi:predicted ATP-binding protein involved in virulence
MSKIIELPIKTVKGDSQKTALNKLINATITELKTPQQSKDSAVAALLANIKPVNLTEVCESLGWRKNGEDSPKQKHIKVAIVDTLIKTAKENNWHIIHDLGFFYIFNGGY